MKHKFYRLLLLTVTLVTILIVIFSSRSDRVLIYGSGGTIIYRQRTDKEKADDKLWAERANQQFEFSLSTSTYDSMTNADETLLFDGELVPQNSRSRNTTLILLVTYLRSGSTWLGEITKQAKNTYYAFEPFQGFIRQGYYANDSVCFNNDTCRKSTENGSNAFVIDSMIQIYSCDFENMHPIVYRKVFKYHMKECSRKFNSNSTRRLRPNREYHACLQQVKPKCFNADYRIVKTIRMSMDLAGVLMGLLPNLKVIHLVRDPRGITNSRLRGKFRLAKNIEPHSRDLCNRMYNDVISGDRLRHEYPDRHTLVMYEALADRPMEGAKYILNFINATFDQRVEEWVYNSSHGNYSGYYSTVRNSTKASSHWRTELLYNRTGVIQNQCQNVFSLLGYATFRNIVDKRNLNLPSRKQVDRAGFL